MIETQKLPDVTVFKKLMASRLLKHWWRLPLLALIILVLWEFWKPLLYLSAFAVTWFAVTLIAMRAKKSGIQSVVSGFVMGMIAIVALAGIFGDWKNPESSAPNDGNSTGEHRFSHTKYDRYFEPDKGAPVYFVKALFANFGRTAFRYEELSSGAIRFFDATDKMQYVFTQPFEIREGRYPEFPKDVVSDEGAKRFEELTKRYLITSYVTTKGWRYSTFKYEIADNGSVRFWNLDTKTSVALPPPYVIEEKLCGEGVKPYGPGFSDSR